LKGLEESLKAGKALFRSSAPTTEMPSPLDLGLGGANVMKFPTAPTEEPPFEIPPVAPPAPPSPVEPLDLSTIPDEEPPRDFADRDDTMRGGKFRVSGGLFEVESPDGALRN